MLVGCLLVEVWCMCRSLLLLSVYSLCIYAWEGVPLDNLDEYVADECTGWGGVGAYSDADTIGACCA